MCAAVIGYSEPGTEAKVEPFGLSFWSQRKTDPKSHMTQCITNKVADVFSTKTPTSKNFNAA